MRLIKLHTFLLAIMMGLAALFISLGLLGVASPALAQGPEPNLNTPVAQPTSEPIIYTVFFTDPANIEITDLSGEVVTQGVHIGSARCDGNNCSRSTNLTFKVYLTDTHEIEYNFTTRHAVDPDERSAVVAGEGTLANDGQTKRFNFVATFQDNRDGTVWVKYEASRPDASFIIPRSPGRFEFGSR